MMDALTRRDVLSLALAAGAAGLLPRSLSAAEGDDARVDALVKAQGISDDGPGVAIAVVLKGEVAFQKGYGLANVKERTPIAVHTQFDIASISKTFTATAIVRLFEKGKLKLTDDVREYVSELPVYNRRRAITIQNLLQQTSGLPDYLDLENDPDVPRDYFTNIDYVRELAGLRDDYPLNFQPGSQYEYSNTNYLLLALVIERVSGSSYAGYLQEQFFQPLELTSTWVHDKPVAPPKHPKFGQVNALGYTKNDSGGYEVAWGSAPFRTEKMLAVGDGGAWSTLGDLAKWESAFRAGKVLNPMLMHWALSPSWTDDGSANDYGFGWELEHDVTGKLIDFGHGGEWGGFMSYCYHDVEPNRTIILLSNRGDIDLEALWDGLDGIFR
ncbi:MAG TPA: serine hydrolase domain-containing protein [Planctomycetaceae bacterium]|nr:serine hydrolase domain-containing protein [Planctomycetaceae bacterium]